MKKMKILRGRRAPGQKVKTALIINQKERIPKKEKKRWKIKIKMIMIIPIKLRKSIQELFRCSKTLV